MLYSSGGIAGVFNAALILRRLHIHHVSQTSHLLRLPANHMHHFSLRSISLNQLVDSSLLARRQVRDDE